MTASSEGKTSSSAITVNAPAPAPVASVSVTPATPSLQVGETVQLSAVTRDANNNVLTGRAVSWTSSNTGVATVSASGLVSALAAGPAQITAISENQSGSATVTVSAPPPPPPPSGSAEPAGMTRITENDFTTPNQDGWYFEYGQVNAATVQDASAPRSPSGVLQLTYPAGMTGGTGPNSLENDWSAGTYKTLYISSWMKVSSNFYGHCGPDVTKTLHVWVSDGTTSGNRLYSNVRGCGTEALSYWVNLQGVVAGGDVDNGTSAELAPNLGQPATIVRGQWQKYELVIKANSAGTRDGTVDWWLDGVHVGSYTGIQFVPGNATWDLMKWNPTWGGLGGVVPAAFTESMDHIYVSGKR
ncbi:MAG TPA: Ig-like domain-containing protein [Candidatus Dormibacteraeota bacterium]